MFCSLTVTVAILEFPNPMDEAKIGRGEGGFLLL